jgi:hypothetical protein
MSEVTTNSLLNQIVAMHNCSLPVYLTYAPPAWSRGEEAAKETASLIAEDQRNTADRAAVMVTENGGIVDNGEFPMYYTGYHDLSFDFLLTEVIKEQKEDITTLEGIASQLSLVPLAKAAAEEALGAAKGHLESLEELRQSPATASS